MPNSLQSEPVRDLLGRLFMAAAGDDLRRVRVDAAHPDGFEPTATREQADAYEEIYIPISPEAGRLLYSLIRAARPSTVVEFGTSFGISTIYLTAAVTDNGTGHVVTTELSARKAEAARSNLQQAGVGDVVTILVGDARQTLATVPGPVGLVLLDGWKNLCLPVLHLLEPKLAPGALVAADDITHDGMADYLDYIRDPASGYVTVAFPVEDGMEISSWTGRPDQ
jgi:predicted O-methyltransferase YrrM